MCRSDKAFIALSTAFFQIKNTSLFHELSIVEMSDSSQFSESNGNFAIPVPDFKPGDIVTGKTNDNVNKRGIIIEEVGDGRRKKYRIVFENGNDNWQLPHSIWRTDNFVDISELENFSTKSCLKLLGIDDAIDDNVSEDSNTSESEEENDENEDSKSEIQEIPIITQSTRGRGTGRGRGRGRSNMIPEQHEHISTGLNQPEVNLLNVRIGRNDVWQSWREVENVVVDPSVSNFYQQSRLKWTKVYSSVVPVGIKSMLDYFKLIFPWNELNHIVLCTNEFITSNGRGREITKGELLKYFGIRLAMSLDRNIGGVESCFREKDQLHSIFRAPDFGNRFLMSLNRFSVIDSCCRLDHYIDNQVGEDRYRPIRRFLNAMNERKVDILVPGRTIVVDECMCSWRGYESYLEHLGAVHVTKIIRKPKSVGIEVKASADGETGMLLLLEIQEGKLSHQEKEFQGTEPYAPFHTAITMRLVKPWFGSGRLVIGDSAFASVQTCGHLLSKGLDFLGVVKTCTTGYPMAYFKNWASTKPERGQWKTVVGALTIQGRPREITAVGWCSKTDMVKTFIGSTSTTLEGNPIRVPRSKLQDIDGIWQKITVERETKRPKLVEDIFKHFSTIDYHDRLRQGYLQMEIYWKTHKWSHRLFATLLGMMFTDCYMAYSYEYDKLYLDESEKLSYYDFMGKMAYELIYNEIDGTNIQTRHISTSIHLEQVDFVSY